MASACGSSSGVEGNPDASAMDVSDVSEDIGEDADGSAEDGGDAEDVQDVPTCEPTDEQCNGEDDDCDDIVDEGCSCTFGETEDGVCSNGTIGEMNGECQAPEDYEEDESGCDDVDNDCDGMVDEGCPCPFDGNMQGVCANGTKSADDGSCLQPENYISGTEDGFQNKDHCDGVDNDCNGVVDEGCPCDFANLDVGVCGDTTRGYINGTCQKPSAYQDNETICDGKDNDCDGEVDESCTCVVGTTESCYTGPSGTDGVGVCSPGQKTCQKDGDDSAFGDCMNETVPTGENCTDNVDNDCDGDTDMADSACSCTIGTTRPCYTGPSGTEGVGACTSGQETCQQAADGTEWSACQNQTIPSVEACGDNIDNDCDGQTDESGSVFEDFEGSDTGWSTFNNGSGTVNTSTSASTAYNGSEAGKAEGPNQGVCGQGGLSKSFNFTQVPTSMTVWVKATTANWGRVSIMLKDSTGITPLWVQKGSGNAVNLSWTQKTFDPSMYTNETSFTLIFGNNDNSQYCSNGDHDWNLLIDDLEIQQPSCSGS
jgi:hypothetical protein